MNLKQGDTGVITFGDNTTAKVKVEKVQDYPSAGLPSDYFFSYQEGETNRQIVHPDIKDMFPLPEFLVEKVFTKDKV
jgi:hypothetical protein